MGQAVKVDDESGEAKKEYFGRTSEVRRLDRLSEEQAGVAQLRKELPGRAAVGIGQTPAEVESQLPRAKAGAAWKSNEGTDRMIREAYAEGSRGAVTELALRLGVDRWRISKRAGELGVATIRLKECDWCDEELEILEEFGDQGGAIVHRELRRRGHERSVGAVTSMLSRRQIKREQLDTWSARSVATYMGVDPHTVIRWITSGGLKARLEGGQWQISRKAMKQWVVTHAQGIDLKRVDKFWFIDMLGG